MKKIRKIKRPVADRLYPIFVTFSVLMVPVGVCGVVFLFSIGDSLTAVMFGLLIAIGPALVTRFWVGRRRNVLSRSLAMASAKVVDQKKVRASGGGSGDLLDLVVVAIEILSPSYKYNLVIEFDAIRTEKRVEPTMLEATVPKDFHDTHPPDTSLDVRYSMEDPAVAILEYEFAEYSQSQAAD